MNVCDIYFSCDLPSMTTTMKWGGYDLEVADVGGEEQKQNMNISIGTLPPGRYCTEISTQL